MKIGVRLISPPWIAAAVLLALAAGFALFGAGGPAHAQGDAHDYVDIGLILEFPDTVVGNLYHDLDIIVVNQGSRTAYDVEVAATVEYPVGTSHFREKPEVPVGSASLDADGYTLSWSIPELGGLQREQVTAEIRHRQTTTGETPFDNRSHPHEVHGTVTTSSFESDLHKGNNASRVWSYSYSVSVLNPAFRQAAGNYSVALSVDKPAPSPGDTVNFTITADRDQPEGYIGLTPPPIDLQVDVELTDGLTVSGTPSYGYMGASKPGSVSYSSGVFIIGTLKRGDGEPPRYSVTLPITVASDAVVNEQCLTATLTGNPPPGTGPRDDDVSDNVAKVCLGAPPARAVVFNSGETSLPTWYNCVGRTAYPCSSTDSVEFTILGESAAVNAGLPYEVFELDKVVIHVPDPTGRATSSASGSSDLVWSTGYNAPPVVRRGVITTEDLVELEPNQWGVDVDEDGTRAGTLNMEVSGPGEMSAWAADGDNTDPYEFFGAATNGELHSGTWYLGEAAWYAEFSKLGTYRVKFSGVIANNNGTPIDTTDDTNYNIAERTGVFHVGPMADLTVENGGASQAVATDQHALTIAAVNNGPDDQVDAEVTIDLTSLPAGVTVADQIARDGAYDSNTGKWDLGTLKTADHRRSAGKPGVATLTLILAGDDAASATATATITDSENYTVCISSDGDTLPHTTHTNCEGDTDAATTNVWHAAVCVNTANDEVDTTYTTEPTCDAETDREWTENVCALSDGSVFANRTETECGASWHVVAVYDYDDSNDTATISAQAGTGGVGDGIPTLQTPAVHAPAVGIAWSEVESLYGLPGQGLSGSVVNGRGHKRLDPAGNRAHAPRAVRHHHTGRRDPLLPSTRRERGRSARPVVGTHVGHAH